MTVIINKPGFNLRETLTSLKRKIGIKGAELMAAETVSDVYTSLNPVMFRNRVHNGDMRIDQRNNGAAISSNAVGDQWPVDRFDLYISTANILSMQQNQGSFTPPPGFKNYVGFTTLAIGSGSAVPNHLIEGLNVADLDWGLATAKTCTLSFWVRSSVPGTHGGFITNQPLNRYYVYKYSINQANTWEYKTVTVPGDTTGTWNKDNTRGICIFFSFRGTSNHSTFNQWYAPGATTLGVSGCVDITQTVGATWCVTGLQFEQGTVATPFEHRPYGTELALCQRYFVKIGGESSISAAGSGVTTGTNSGWGVVKYPVTMRVAPTTTLNGTGITLSNGSAFPTSPTLGTVYANRDAAMISLTYSGAPYSGAGQGTTLYFQNAANDSMSFSSEL